MSGSFDAAGGALGDVSARLRRAGLRGGLLVRCAWILCLLRLDVVAPAAARRRMAGARISGAEVNPDNLCRAMLQGQNVWARFKDMDPYVLEN